ncbi:hypothetical protein [Agromyces silvae]|uniref:hypothetical protein n=1 Tax=Agromyces silvae TaxID=3388266 RepID=UPI00280AE430|nr:hypothetical protein [Agromyces protaetiae]
MISAATEPSNASSDWIATGLAISALIVSLLAVLVPAITGRQQLLRDDRANRGEKYLELMELVEHYGLWVGDQTYDLLETSDDDYRTEMPHRRTARPQRATRVRARAIVSAYASTKVFRAFELWQSTLERFEAKLDEFSFVAQEDGHHSVDARQAEPLCEAERVARGHLADAVNRQLVQERRWRRPKQPVVS